MAFEIVDGMTGTKHISSDDLAALNTATVGKADCVLEYGNDFSLTMASAVMAEFSSGCRELPSPGMYAPGSKKLPV